MAALSRQKAEIMASSSPRAVVDKVEEEEVE